MKTTIDIADGLLRQAKRLAHKKNKTLKTLLEEALRDRLAREEMVETDVPLQLHTFRGKGLQRGLSWDSWQEIHELAYEGRGG